MQLFYVPIQGHLLTLYVLFTARENARKDRAYHRRATIEAVERDRLRTGIYVLI